MEPETRNTSLVTASTVFFNLHVHNFLTYNIPCFHVELSFGIDSVADTCKYLHKLANYCMPGFSSPSSYKYNPKLTFHFLDRRTQTNAIYNDNNIQVIIND